MYKTTSYKFQFLIGIINLKAENYAIYKLSVSIPYRYYKSNNNTPTPMYPRRVSIPYRYYKS